MLEFSCSGSYPTTQSTGFFLWSSAIPGFPREKKNVKDQKNPTVHKVTFHKIVKILTTAWDISVVILHSHSR